MTHLNKSEESAGRLTLAALNRASRAEFTATLGAVFEARLAQSRDTEIETALAEISAIAALRIEALLGGLS